MGLRHRQTVASIESGERQLSATELIRVMQILGVDLDYFTDPFRLVGEGQFSFRTKAVVDAEVLDQFERRVGRWLAMYRELSREQGHLPQWLGHKLNLSARSSLEDAQAAGEAAAEAWHLGSHPAERLRSVMEDRLRVLVLYVDTPTGVSGAASRVPGLNCALVNRQESEGRRNFDLAHELFHLLTWDTMPPERATVVDKRRRDKQWRVERLAENFAAALLMPAAVLTPAWEADASAGEVHDRINMVAERFKVSSQACKWRLDNLGLLSKGEVESIDTGLLATERNSACRETDVPPFSRLFAQRIATALNDGRLSVKRAAGVVGASPRSLAQMLQGYGHEACLET